MAAGKQDHRQRHAQKPTVKGHATLPDLENFKRIANEKCRIVEQHIAKPPAQNDAKQNMIEQRVELTDAHRRTGSSRLAPQQIIAKQQSGDIGKGVPTDSKAAKLNRKGIEIRKDDTGWRVCHDA